ncbi:hypothetical protein GCM10028807_25790 [Spirosoma daeguense]
MNLSRNLFRILYLTIGIGSILFFIWTGRYLRSTYPDKQTMDMGLRVMLRSRHIFILLVSLIEVGIGVYIEKATTSISLFIQWLATIGLFMAHGLFIYAFFYEVDPVYIPQTPIMHVATYLILGSLSLHFLSRLNVYVAKR